MAEPTRLEALGSWLFRSPGGRAYLVLGLVIMIAVGAIWMGGLKFSESADPPSTAGIVKHNAPSEVDSSEGEQASNESEATVHGDGVAFGRDGKIEGDVNF